MTAKTNASLAGVAALLVLVASAGAQSGATVQNSRGRTSAEALHARGIELSEQSLLSALRNPDPKIRRLAASQLQSDRDSDAVPYIKQALLDEKDARTRIGIAAALSGLHDADGTKELQAMCVDTNLPIQFVISATQTLQMLSVQTAVCLPRVLQSLASPAEVDYRYVTLSLLPTISRSVTPEQLANIVTAIEHLLLDRQQQPAVRLEASNALAEIAFPSSAAALEKALKEEKDPTMRSSFQVDLARLNAQPISQ